MLICIFFIKKRRLSELEIDMTVSSVLFIYFYLRPFTDMEEAAAKSCHVIKQVSRRCHGAVYESPFAVGQPCCPEQSAHSHWFVGLPAATNGEARFLQTAASPGS